MSYESAKLLNEYLLMHYGSKEDLMPWEFGPANAIGFPARTVGHFSQANCTRALDLGCAVGRSSFEMSRAADEVIGIDFSHSFIKAAEALRDDESLDYDVLETGKITKTRCATLKSLPTDIQAQNCSFEQGDAMNLREDLGLFDRVHAANLICRLPEPEKLLTRLPHLVKQGGELVLATPCTWLDEYTPSDNQPEQDTFSWLKNKLSEHFTLKEQTNESFLIRETARKFQWTVSLVTIWERN